MRTQMATLAITLEVDENGSMHAVLDIQGEVSMIEALGMLEMGRAQVWDRYYTQEES